MKKTLLQKLDQLFRPTYTFDIDLYEVLEALGDGVTRKTWLFELALEIKRINLEIDKKLLSGLPLSETILADLSGRRRSLQFVLEAVLSAKRDTQRRRGQNPATKAEFDLDSVTLQPGL